MFLLFDGEWILFLSVMQSLLFYFTLILLVLHKLLTLPLSYSVFCILNSELCILYFVFCILYFLLKTHNSGEKANSMQKINRQAKVVPELIYNVSTDDNWCMMHFNTVLQYFNAFLPLFYFILFHFILFYFILFYSILFYPILFYLHIWFLRNRHFLLPSIKWNCI